MEFEPLDRSGLIWLAKRVFKMRGNADLKTREAFVVLWKTSITELGTLDNAELISLAEWTLKTLGSAGLKDLHARLCTYVRECEYFFCACTCAHALCVANPNMCI